MKLSKLLLQAILVGATIGATTTACTKSNDLEEADAKKSIEKNTDHHGGTYGECPACGMG